MDQIEQKISSYISKNILFSKNGYPFSSDASFLENGIVDSMNILELVMYVEENFGLSVADEDIVPNNFDSVARMTSYIKSKM